MKNLKHKIISIIKKEIKSETEYHIKKIESELEELEIKDRKRKFNPFNFIKINYWNFKDGYLNFGNFVLTMIFNIYVYSMVITPTFILFLNIISGKTIIPYDIVFPSYFLCAVAFIFDLFPERTPEIKNHIIKLKNRIDNTKLRLQSANSSIEKIFENEEPLSQSIRVDNFEKNEVNIFNRPIDISILKEIERELTESQILKLLEKSRADIINCNDLIEMIRELDNKDKAKKNYNKLFPFSSMKNKKIKENSYA